MYLERRINWSAEASMALMTCCRSSAEVTLILHHQALRARPQRGQKLSAGSRRSPQDSHRAAPAWVLATELIGVVIACHSGLVAPIWLPAVRSRGRVAPAPKGRSVVIAAETPESGIVSRNEGASA